jgi:hypothetical protein
MKKLILFVMWCIPAALVAQTQNGVKVSGLVVNAGTVIFNVSWDNVNRPEAWVDSAWVFVDYNNKGEMERLPLSAGATLTETSAPGIGRVAYEPDNTKGVWVVGNARDAGAFSATVKLVTAVTEVGGACAYASDYPPVGKYTSATDVAFTGTPQYTIVIKKDADGTTETRKSNGPLFTVPDGFTVESFTDKTGAPGIVHCFSPAPPTVVDAIFCFGLPGQLQAAASGNATIAWYDAPAAGNLLCIGNVLPLTPLYNDVERYYAQAVSEKNCPSTRIEANYIVNHCVINGYCPGFEAGNVGSGSAPEAACSAYDSGRIGLVNYQATCEVFYPGQIGSEQHPVACMSYDAGWIGR